MPLGRPSRQPEASAIEIFRQLPANQLRWGNSTALALLAKTSDPVTGPESNLGLKWPPGGARTGRLYVHVDGISKRYAVSEDLAPVSEWMLHNQQALVPPTHARILGGSVTVA